jgi:sulfite exporter TauE/SafE
MFDLLLIAALGFVGSFGHCLGMCGPLTAAFSLSQAQERSLVWQKLGFHVLLNTGRIVSYALVGAGIGAVGSVLIASGQMAGIGSSLRHIMTLLTGALLVWFGVLQINPKLLPRLPFLHPVLQGNWHQRLSTGMMQLSLHRHWWTPFLLGMVWGLIPCGFLYAAQIKAAETGTVWAGCATLLAFGLGTLPVMLGVGMTTSWMSQDQRSQLFHLGGWITLSVGLLTLLRTGDTTTDYTGHTALILLVLTLAARPLSRVWATLLRYRRALGVGAFILSLAHTLHMVAHSWDWNLDSVFFMLPQHQWAIAAGGASLLLMLPLAMTSFDWAQRQLGQGWRSLHLLAIPALILAIGHTIGIGSHYLGALQLTWINYSLVSLLVIVSLLTLASRYSLFWSLLKLEKWYVAPKSK